MMLVQPTLASKKETYSEANIHRKAFTHSDAQSCGILRSLAMLAQLLAMLAHPCTYAIRTLAMHTLATFIDIQGLGI